MKNLRTFEQFVNESFNQEKLFEKKELSPANIKAYNANKNSVAKLKNWSYKLKDIEVKFKDLEYYSDKPLFFDFLNTGNGLYNSSNTGFYMYFDIAGLIVKSQIMCNKDKLDVHFYDHNNGIDFSIKKLNFLQYIDENEDKVLGFIDLLDFLFKNFESEIYEFISGKIGLETLYVIKAGEIAPATGKTGHGWSIYDYPDGVLGATKYGMMLWNAKGFNVGDKFKILDDQTHKLIANEVEIIDLVPATYKDFVEYSRRNGREIPVAPFKKQTGRGRYTLYSIK
jgi:hypothetical protein